MKSETESADLQYFKDILLHEDDEDSLQSLRIKTLSFWLMTYIPALTPVRIRLPYSLLPNILKQQSTSIKQFVLFHKIRFWQRNKIFLLMLTV